MADDDQPEDNDELRRDHSTADSIHTAAVLIVGAIAGWPAANIVISAVFNILNDHYGSWGAEEMALSAFIVTSAMVVLVWR